MNAADWTRIAEQLPPAAVPVFVYMPEHDDADTEAGHAVKTLKHAVLVARPAAATDEDVLAWARKKGVTHWTPAVMPDSEG